MPQSSAGEAKEINPLIKEKGRKWLLQECLGHSTIFKITWAREGERPCGRSQDQPPETMVREVGRQGAGGFQLDGEIQKAVILREKKPFQSRLFSQEENIMAASNGLRYSALSPSLALRPQAVFLDSLHLGVSWSMAQSWEQNYLPLLQLPFCWTYTWAHKTKRPWCWERLKAGEGDEREWDCWMTSSTQWSWVWANSGR